MNIIDAENKTTRFGIVIVLGKLIYYLNIYTVSYIRFSIFAILFSKIHICRLNVKILEIDENKEFGSLQDYQDVHFLCMKTCTLLHSTQENRFKRYLTSYNSTSMFQFSYPNDIFLEFEFFNEKLIEKKEEVSIYIEKTDYRILICFLKLLETNECTMKIEPVVFFEFLKYLNIFRVNRNNEYKIFIKLLVFHSIMFNEEYFARISAGFCLCHREYNNLHVRDVIECFFKFYLLSKKFIYELFHKYNPMIFSMRNRLYKKYKLDKNYISLQIEEFEFYFYNHLLNLKFYEIWKVMIGIFYINKFYVDFYTFPRGINLNIVVSSFPPNVRKISILIQHKYLPIFHKLNETEYFKSIKIFKLIIPRLTNPIEEIIRYLKNSEKLTLVFREIEINEIISLESITALEYIKNVKIISLKYIDLHLKHHSSLFLKKKEKFNVDLCCKIELSDFLAASDTFIKYNLNKYIVGINLVVLERTYIPSDFKEIFDFESIKRLKLDFKNVKSNCLENYIFLESFKSLTKLYFSNIKLTSELFGTLLKSNSLVLIWFKMFSFDKEINAESLNILNQSVICMEFYDLDDFLNVHFFYFISKFMSLKYLSITLLFTYNLNRKNYGFEEKIIDLNISHIKKCSHLPSLCSFKYDNRIKCKRSPAFSILHVFTFFFDLDSLEKLVYDSEFLYQEDLETVGNLKVLRSLKLYIYRKNMYGKLLEAILRSNIKETIFELHISVHEFTNEELISILQFKKLKFLFIYTDFFEERNNKYVELLRGLNLIEFKSYLGIGTDNIQ
ncbi:hypothetical protein LUQ84_000121 [Hamiltosporidium tvaerminnensis]|nr:hypothetical protein LUQ84_000121 [Hamiltosporidium tvaerminnensis]